MAYNQPKFSPCDRWNPDAITFANSSDSIVPNCYSIFIDSNNSIYATATDATFVRIWINGGSSLTRNTSAGLTESFAVFTHSSGDIYVDSGGKNRTEKWSVNATSGVPVIFANGGCHGLFIDIDDQIYCSCTDFHTVTKQSVHDAPSSWSNVAGNGTDGSGPYLLNKPIGIFVDTTLSVYIADSANHRDRKSVV